MVNQSVNEHINVCVVTGSRAEYGLLRPLLFRLWINKDIVLKLVVTGSHLSERLGNTQQEIIDDGFDISARIKLPLENDSKKGMVLATSIAMASFGEYFEKNRPDILIILGDRYEILAAAIAAHFMGIPIAHISGGDVTEGAIDDSIRHCLTKMSNLHFPGCQDSANRIVQMGEDPEKVFNVGELGIENCLQLKLMTRRELANNLRFLGVMKNYCVVTFHPVTREDNTALKQVYELIKAMDAQKNMYYIITLANADSGGRVINELWQNEMKSRDNWLLIPSLGVRRYLSAVKYAQAVVGNSSSGIFEAPAMGTPTINIGDRQKGRMIAKSVVCCEPELEKIKMAFNTVLTAEFLNDIKNQNSPFGDGNTSVRILNKVVEYCKYSTGRNIKTFIDIKCT